MSSSNSPNINTPIDSNINHNNNKTLLIVTDLEQGPPNQNHPRKNLDLNSYFNDLPHHATTHPKRSKSITITRPVRRALRFKRLNKTKRSGTTTLTVPPSRDEQQVEEEDDDGDDDEVDKSEEGSDDEREEEWVKERWNALLNRQRLAEADVRRTILNRNRLDPLELSQWLDSEDTCTLPLPNLGVQLRMVDQ